MKRMKRMYQFLKNNLKVQMKSLQKHLGSGKRTILVLIMRLNMKSRMMVFNGKHFSRSQQERGPMGWMLKSMMGTPGKYWVR